MLYFSMLLNILVFPLVAILFYSFLKNKRGTCNRKIIFKCFASVFFVYPVVTAIIFGAEKIFNLQISVFGTAYTVVTALISFAALPVYKFCFDFFGVEIKTKSEKKHLSLYIVTTVVIFLIIALIVTCLWMKNSFVFSFQEMMFTLSSPSSGANLQALELGLKACLPHGLMYVLCVTFFTVLDYRKSYQVFITKHKFTKNQSICISKNFRVAVVWLSILTLLGSLIYFLNDFGFFDYYFNKSVKTSIYEERYVNPADVNISAGENKKNLLMIYVESLENTYQSYEKGGYNDVNYMPGLTLLAEENISFSDDDKIGGLRPASGTTWTFASIYSSTSGTAFSFDLSENDIFDSEHIVPGLVTLGDILEINGYNQVFLCGSDASFGGRDKYFSHHGNYLIFDLDYAHENGYIPVDYSAWWGFEDKYLYSFAKNELNRLYSEGRPFNLTMLTADTHAIGGYRCSLCENEYGQELGNIVACTDKQLTDFVEWCKKQPFYEDTVIIIMGDHPRMDTELVSGVEYYDRTNYNCFINADYPDNVRLKNREATNMDIFPTTLSALGFEIEGNRLGLGVNLFSDIPTIPEEIGFSQFESELKKDSDFYKKDNQINLLE